MGDTLLSINTLYGGMHENSLLRSPTYERRIRNVVCVGLDSDDIGTTFGGRNVRVLCGDGALHRFRTELESFNVAVVVVNHKNVPCTTDETTDDVRRDVVAF